MGSPLYVRGWRAAFAFTLGALTLGSGCTLFEGRHFNVEVGVTGVYVYIGTVPTDQLLWVYNDICGGNISCAAGHLANVQVADGFAGEWWRYAWLNHYAQGSAGAMLNNLSFLKWVSGGQSNYCAVLVRLSFPWVNPVNGDLIFSYWETREIGRDGCERGVVMR